MLLWINLEKAIFLLRVVALTPLGSSHNATVLLAEEI